MSPLGRKRPNSAVLADDGARLRAERQRVEAELRDLEAEIETLTEQKALARHLGRGDLAKIENRLHKASLRLVDLAPELDDLTKATTILTRDIVRALRVEAVDRVVAAKEKRKPTAAEVEKLTAALYRARARDDEKAAAIEAAELDAERVEAEVEAIEAALQEGVADPIGHVTRQRAEAEETTRLREDSEIEAAVNEFADGAPREHVLARVPEHLHRRVQAGMAPWTAEKIDKRKWDRLIANAEATGQGLIRDGQTIVHPRRERVPAIEIRD